MNFIYNDFYQELKLVDEYEEQCVPSGGFAFEADPVQRRNGRAPTKVDNSGLQIDC